MKFAILSDLHHISRKLMCDNPPESLLLHQYAAAAALKQASEEADIDTIILTGDLTEHGDHDSHREFTELLRAVKAKGKKVYVLTATHDFNLGRNYTATLGEKDIYKEKPWEQGYFDVENDDFCSYLKGEYKNLSEEEATPKLSSACTRPELWEIYREFGRDQAISVCDEGASYCVELDSETWMIMLNDDYRDPDRSGVHSNYPLSCYRWIKDLVKEAKSKGKYIFACTHHPLVPPVPAYKIGGGDMNMRGAFIGHRLADMGIDLVFSGHTHFSDVGFMTSDKGNMLCNITTPAVKNYPPQYRVVDLDGKNGYIKIKSRDIEEVYGFDLKGESYKEYLRKAFIKDYETIIGNLKSPLNKIILGLKVKHIYSLCRFSARLSREEYKSIKDRRIFDILMELVLNMFSGDGIYTPDTPVYKFMMGASAVLDSIINAQPFYDLKKKLLKGYSVSEVVEPLLFNNFIPDGNAEFYFTEKPMPRYETKKTRSFVGEFLIAVLCILMIPVAIWALPVIGLVILPALAIKKKKDLKKNPVTPERY